MEVKEGKSIKGMQNTGSIVLEVLVYGEGDRPQTSFHISGSCLQSPCLGPGNGGLRKLPSPNGQLQPSLLPALPRSMQTCCPPSPPVMHCKEVRDGRAMLPRVRTPPACKRHPQAPSHCTSSRHKRKKRMKHLEESGNEMKS